MTAAAKNIILGVTGSIAAHKAVDLASLLTKKGCDVHVVMTADAQRFITAAALQNALPPPGRDRPLRRGGRLEADAHRAGG